MLERAFVFPRTSRVFGWWNDNREWLEGSSAFEGSLWRTYSIRRCLNPNHQRISDSNISNLERIPRALRLSSDA